MINRKTLRCLSCGTKVTTRNGFGHAKIQKHRFPCPACRVEIGFVLELYQKAVSFKYEQPTNAEWINTGEDSEQMVLFYPELMIPKDLEAPMSPFVVTVHNLKNIEQYQREEAIRRASKDELWPALQRAYVHFENGNLPLMKKECQSVIKGMPDLTDQENRGGWILAITRQFFDRFVAYPKRSERIERVIATASRKAEKELRKLATEYVTSGRMTALWKEVKSVRTQFMCLYESLLPLLMVRRYWKSHHQKLELYMVSVKDFEELRTFYVDTVETSFKLLVIGLGVQVIADTGNVVIATKKGNHDIWWFEQIKNGIKDTQLRKYPVFKQITEALDLKLRNGVGHHSAHYDLNTDAIIYATADGATMTHVSVPYTEFVDKVFQAFCAFELATVFFQWLFVAGGGKL